MSESSEDLDYVPDKKEIERIKMLKKLRETKEEKGPAVKVSKSVVDALWKDIKRPIAKKKAKKRSVQRKIGKEAVALGFDASWLDPRAKSTAPRGSAVTADARPRTEAPPRAPPKAPSARARRPTVSTLTVQNWREFKVHKQIDEHALARGVEELGHTADQSFLRRTAEREDAALQEMRRKLSRAEERAKQRKAFGL
eukprot:gnl/Chilomastix_cuspidata/4440.p1 GENE.gnl/Chilomastix_cuspidata/4440~~gnl/Chilomastix_cuspidata/4440.p1  ORF type:complete len:197 (-),score=61.41 gnl/Chilomastix_cuspidata/4440:103-693(-)